jgi:hypothetical protein
MQAFFVVELLASVAGILEQINIYDLYIALKKYSYKLVTFNRNDAKPE